MQQSYKLNSQMCLSFQLHLLTLKWMCQLLCWDWHSHHQHAAAALIAVLAVVSIIVCLQIQSCYHSYVHCSWVEPISHARICFKTVHLSRSCKENLHHTTAERHQTYCVPHSGPFGVQCMWLRPHPCLRPSSPRLLSAGMWL